MPHSNRREGPWRSEQGRGGRMQSRPERDRYSMQDEDRFSERREASSWNRDEDSDRSYFAEREGQDRDEPSRWTRGTEDNYDYERGAEQDASSWGRRSFDRDTSEQWRSRGREQGPGRGREGYASGQPNRAYYDLRSGRGPMHWDEEHSGAQYFGTGGHYGAYSTGPSARASGSAYGDRGYLGASESLWHDQPRTWDEDDDRSAGSTGGSDVYAQSRYGAQGGYDRPYGESSGGQRGYGQNYREQFAEQRYGRDPEFGYGFSSGTSGTFRGRGPKGYERSDDRLREMICERLTDDPRIDASDVHIEVKDKIVKLTGTVTDRRSKYEIEDVVERCGGVKDIDNQVRVRSGAGMTQSSGGAIRSNQQTFNEGIVGSSSSDTDTKSAASRASSSTKRT